jgi:hypothetical protein
MVLNDKQTLDGKQEYVRDRLRTMVRAPFTVQRVCEVLVDPHQSYRDKAGLTRALEKLLRATILHHDMADDGGSCAGPDGAAAAADHGHCATNATSGSNGDGASPEAGQNGGEELVDAMQVDTSASAAAAAHTAKDLNLVAKAPSDTPAAGSGDPSGALENGDGDGEADKEIEGGGKRKRAVADVGHGAKQQPRTDGTA